MNYDPVMAWGESPEGSPGYDAMMSARRAAIAAARRSAARDEDVGDGLSDYAGGTAPFVVDDMRGIHYLRRDGGLFGGATYCARIDLPGVLAPLLLSSRAAEVPGDGDAFGPVVELREPLLDRHFRARSRASDLVRAFDIDAVGACLPRRGVRVALRPEAAQRTVLEVDAAVGKDRRCTPAAEAAQVLARIARAIVDTGLVFAERGQRGATTPAELSETLARITEAASWLSGPVARVGDGVEARLALDEQPELASVLRVDLEGGRARVYFEGRFAESFAQTTTLRPQENWLDHLRGLADARVGDVDFDAAWLCSGDGEALRLLAACAPQLQRLRSLSATVDLGPAGLIVRVPPFSEHDGDVTGCCGAVLSLWRRLVRRRLGRDGD
jgi:hypothetical protein